MSLRQDEEVKLVPKGWGEERWIHNDELYCGKLLVLRGGKHCSLHYHEQKTETFYVARGRLRMELGPGDAILLKPGMVHRFTGLAEETHIFEFSTQHFDVDSHRVVPGD